MIRRGRLGEVEAGKVGGNRVMGEWRACYRGIIRDEGKRKGRTYEEVEEVGGDRRDVKRYGEKDR